MKVFNVTSNTNIIIMFIVIISNNEFSDIFDFAHEMIFPFRVDKSFPNQRRNNTTTTTQHNTTQQFPFNQTNFSSLCNLDFGSENP